MPRLSASKQSPTLIKEVQQQTSHLGGLFPGIPKVGLVRVSLQAGKPLTSQGVGGFCLFAMAISWRSLRNA